MLEGLLAFLEGPLSGDPFVRLDSLRFDALDAVIDVSVTDFDSEEIWTRWRIRGRNVRECDVRGGGSSHSAGDLRLLEADHVLIRQHTAPRMTLHFSRAPESAVETLGRLWVSHRHEAGDWIPFERYLNHLAPLADMVAGGFGLLADGPDFLIQAYARVLSEAGLGPSVSEPRPAKWWNGREWSPNPPDLAAMMLGESSFVAEHFDAEQLSRSGG